MGESVRRALSRVARRRNSGRVCLTPGPRRAAEASRKPARKNTQFSKSQLIRNLCERPAGEARAARERDPRTLQQAGIGLIDLRQPSAERASVHAEVARECSGRTAAGGQQHVNQSRHDLLEIRGGRRRQRLDIGFSVSAQ